MGNPAEDEEALRHEQEDSSGGNGLNAQSARVAGLEPCRAPADQTRPGPGTPRGPRPGLLVLRRGRRHDHGRGRSSSASRRSSSRRRGRTSGSARTSAATSRPSAPTTPAGASTSTTTTSAPSATARSSSGCRSSPSGSARAREALEKDLALRGLTRERVMACAIRLLDIGLFRVGGEDYAEENESYGLATIQKQHVHMKKNEIVFDYVAKGGLERSYPSRTGSSCPPWSRSSAGAASRPTSSSPTTSRAASGATSPQPTSTSGSRTSSARTTRPRTSGPGTAPSSPR